ncbi:hypothetical protein C5167_036642 [Papaver somniferum]|uniref:Uncharacterized protein n=1 Tax=Papaver somniferum TaxID=3469 RepID=A0A4Y7I8G1_PAPSO|nr:hypothetical protein C5167_036642 [Papaver somniferum]
MRMAFVEKKNRFRFAVPKNSEKRHGLMVKDMTRTEDDWTFLLCYPSSVASDRIVGKILTAIEGIGLDIIGEGAIEKARQLTSQEYESYFTCQKVIQLTSEKETVAPGRLKAYTSDSYKSAVEDYELWFGSDSLFTWRKQVEASKYLACAFPDGTVSGPTVDVRENIVKLEPYITVPP